MMGIDGGFLMVKGVGLGRGELGAEELSGAGENL